MNEQDNQPIQAEQQMSFEEALMRLENIVAQLENGGLSLEDSMRAFEDGMKLNAFCGAKLAEAEKKIEKLVRQKDNSLAWEPMAQP